VSETTNNHDHPPTPAASPTLKPLSLSDRVRSLRLPQQPAAPRSGTPWLPWTVAGLLAVCSLYLLTSRPGSKAESAEENPSPGAALTNNPGKQAADGEIATEADGWIQPTRLYKVGPNQVGGKVQFLHADFLEGKKVSKGEVLARLEDTEFRTKFEQAEGDYQQARHDVEAARQRWLVMKHGNRPEEIKQTKAELEEARTTLKKMELELERNDELKTGRAVARRDYEEAKFGYAAQKKHVAMLAFKFKLMSDGFRVEQKQEAFANWKLAVAKMARAKAARDEAKWRLDNCVIFAPISGTILKKYVELGDPLDARAFTLAAILCDMADLTDLEVELLIQERDIARVRVGQECRIVAKAHPERAFKGFVSRLMPTADRAKGAIPVRVKVKAGEITRQDAGKYLSPDGAARVTIYNKSARGSRTRGQGSGVRSQESEKKLTPDP
jgi:multidrug resistance efflux pump